MAQACADAGPEIHDVRGFYFDRQTLDALGDLIVDIVDRVRHPANARAPHRAMDRAPAFPERHEAGGVAIVVLPNLGGAESCRHGYTRGPDPNVRVRWDPALAGLVLLKADPTQ